MAKKCDGAAVASPLGMSSGVQNLGADGHNDFKIVPTGHGFRRVGWCPVAWLSRGREVLTGCVARAGRQLLAEREGIRTPDTIARVPHLRCLKPLSHLSDF